MSSNGNGYNHIQPQRPKMLAYAVLIIAVILFLVAMSVTSFTGLHRANDARDRVSRETTARIMEAKDAAQAACSRSNLITEAVQALATRGTNSSITPEVIAEAPADIQALLQLLIKNGQANADALRAQANTIPLYNCSVFPPVPR